MTSVLIERLFEEKEDLVEDYVANKFGLVSQKDLYLRKKYDLILNTDFKELGLSNQKSRDAYVDNEMADMKHQIELDEVKLELLKLKLSLVNDRIKNAIKQ